MVEQHSAMRFAWLLSKEGLEQPPALGSAGRLIFVAYNLIWWLPVVLVILGIVSYWVGFIGFLAISVLRAAANVYRNNVLPIEEAQRFPLRSP